MEKLLLRPYRARKNPWTLELDEAGARLFNERGELLLTLAAAEVLTRIKAPGFWDVSSNIEISGSSGKHVFLGEKAPLQALRAYHDSILYQKPEAVQALKTGAIRGMKWEGGFFLFYLVVLAIVIIKPDLAIGKTSLVIFLVVGGLLLPAGFFKSVSSYRRAIQLEKQQQSAPPH
jgi:hypothetical protein